MPLLSVLKMILFFTYFVVFSNQSLLWFAVNNLNYTFWFKRTTRRSSYIWASHLCNHCGFSQFQGFPRCKNLPDVIFVSLPCNGVWFLFYDCLAVLFCFVFFVLCHPWVLQVFTLWGEPKFNTMQGLSFWTLPPPPPSPLAHQLML